MFGFYVKYLKMQDFAPVSALHLFIGSNGFYKSFAGNIAFPTQKPIAPTIPIN